MMIKVLVVAPYPGLVHITQELKSELPEFDVTIIQGDLDEVLPDLANCEEQGFDIVISRGGTARLIRQHTSLPVVEIQVSGYDIMRMLALVNGYEAKYEMIGFSNIVENVSAVASLMKVDIPYQRVKDESEVDTAILGAKERGVKIIVGDAVTVRKAKAAGLEGILITSGRESVLDAFSRAKQIYRSVSRYRNDALLYRRMLSSLDQGVALFRENGELLDANEAFRSTINMNQEAHFLFELVKLTETVKDLAVCVDEDRLFRLTGEVVRMEEEACCYMLICQADQPSNGLVVHDTRRFLDSFPPLIASVPQFVRLLASVRRAADEKEAVLLYGEKGSGKRLLAAELARGSSLMLEAEIIRPTQKSLSLLQTWHDRLPAGSVILLRGADKLDEQLQNWLADALAERKIRWILACDKDPKTMRECLSERLHRLLRQRIVHVPPLRRLSINLEEYIRLFIAMFNEKYGKQIVGVRQEVMEALVNHPWPGNLIEMRDTVNAFVRQTAGHFVESDVLSLLGKNSETEKCERSGKWINLNQPLDAIEREVIEFVLRDVDMNQTRAAERLGINRSTLWRKLKKPLAP